MSDAKNGQKRRFAKQGLQALPKAVRLAQEMGQGLGRGALLFGSVQGWKIMVPATRFELVTP